MLGGTALPAQASAARHQGGAALVRIDEAARLRAATGATHPTLYVGDNASPYAVTLVEVRSGHTKTVPFGQYNPLAFAAGASGSVEYVAAQGSDEAGSPSRLVEISSTGSAGKPIAVNSDAESVGIAPGGRTAYVLNGLDAAVDAPGAPGTITPVDLAAGRSGHPIDVGVDPQSLTIAPDGREAFVADANPSNGEPTVVTPVDLVTGAARPAIRVAAAAIAVTPDSRWADAATSQGLVQINTATGAAGKLISLGPTVPVDMILPSGGTTLYVLGTPDTGLAPGPGDVTLTPVDAMTGTVGRAIALTGLPATAPPYYLAATPDGSQIEVLAPGSGKSPSLLAQVDTLTRKLARVVKVGKGCDALAVDPDGATVYVLDPGSAYEGPPTAGLKATHGHVVPVSVATGALGTPITVGVGANVMSIAPATSSSPSAAPPAAPPAPSPAKVPGLAQSYTGTARDVTSATSSTFALSGITESASGALAGTFAFRAPLDGVGPFTGKIGVKNVSFTVKPTAASCHGCTSIVFTGTVSAMLSLSGTWIEHTATGAVVRGTWEIGSTWNGGAHNITYDESDRFTLTHVVESASGAITGTVIWAPPLVGNGPFTGSLHGSAIAFTIPKAADFPTSIVFKGTLIAAAGTMSGTYVAGTQHGTWHADRPLHLLS